jgi:hypothetical protein
LDWKYISSSKMGKASRIRVPESIFDLNILPRPGGPGGSAAYWSYEKNSGATIISKKPLVINKIKNVGKREIGSAADGYRLTVPSPLVSSGNKKTTKSKATASPDKAQIRDGSTIHFISTKEMIETNSQSVYALSTEKLQSILLGKSNPHVEKSAREIVKII